MLWSIDNGNSSLVIEYTGSGLISGSYSGSIPDPYNEFATYANVNAQNYAFSTDNGLNFVIYRNINSGMFRATLSTGYSDSTMPNNVLQGITEMASWIYKNSATGGNWFGLNSVATGGAGRDRQATGDVVRAVAQRGAGCHQAADAGGAGHQEEMTFIKFPCGDLEPVIILKML